MSAPQQQGAAPQQPHHHPAPQTTVPLQGAAIEAESEENSEVDSTLGESDASSFTTSLASSVVDYPYENGRRYHKFREGEYLYPNDEPEQDRLDMLHHIYRLMLGGSLHKAALPPSPQRVIDLGTGTGIWALDFADEYPSATVEGVDLSPIQPRWIPPNCKFIVDDIEAEWPYPTEQAFDYIHQRNMVGSVGDWDRLYEQAYKHTKPGGYIELQEFRVDFLSQQGPLPENSEINKWQKQINAGTASFGKPLNVIEDLANKLKAAGFVDVHEDILKIPIGAWPKDKNLKLIGQFMQLHAIESVEPLTLALFTRVLGWTELECQVLIGKVQEEFKTSRKQLFVYTHFITGRKADRAHSED
ncbi:S-adenosyl-L-methionine-dependent methyltransferase [Xylona heveae TC161]|uniref:S-adenosyl-L-methionine-dependent methyltransferase n=1 Tax=Xylona heveae (strain CBS 132557 / TC161) TaxID=1328760 RepID=A0A165HH76_XYLHT|nr:S-adenosyl-L-methionine-dependent methyltransferase [Xylona heveae TC161]KZF23510.1 S-adenosyl-L-methionine-dependent methyltransferase [Xylona heveae TC161]